jgi:hypothetical protein
MAFIETVGIKNSANISINPATEDKQLLVGSVGNVSSQVVTIQGIDGMTPVNININNFPLEIITNDVNLANTITNRGYTSTEAVSIQGVMGMTPVNTIISNFPVNQTTSDVNLANTIVLPGNTSNNANLIIIGGQTNDIIPQYQELPLSAGGKSIITSGNISNFPTNQITTDVNLANTIVSAGSTSNIANLIIIGGITNDAIPQYQELPLSSNGNSIITSTLDNVTLNSATNLSIGPGAAVNTSGFNQISFQFYGTFTGVIHIEISNDGINWGRSLFQDIGSNLVSDFIACASIVGIPANSKFVRYYVDNIVGTSNVLIIGKNSPNDISLMEMACDTTSGITMQTNIVSGINTDINKSIILSDAPTQMTLEGAVNTSIIIDTKGYDSFNITTQNMAGAVYSSNDQITWSALSGFPLVLGALVSTIAANTGYSFPCVARYVKLVVTTAGSAILFLRDIPWSASYTTSGPTSTLTTTTNLNQLSGASPVTAGLAGTLAVGGNLPAGSVPTTNPLLVGGVDNNNLIRKLGFLQTALNIQNIQPVPVMDLTQQEGQSFLEILAQILTELKINNYYLYNLPLMLNNSMGALSQNLDEPNQLRTDPTLNVKGEL